MKVHTWPPSSHGSADSETPRCKAPQGRQGGCKRDALPPCEHLCSEPKRGGVETPQISCRPSPGSTFPSIRRENSGPAAPVTSWRGGPGADVGERVGAQRARAESENRRAPVESSKRHEKSIG